LKGAAFIHMQMPAYLSQTENPSKSDRVKQAIAYFLKLIKQHNSADTARRKVFQKTGVVI